MSTFTMYTKRYVVKKAGRQMSQSIRNDILNSGTFRISLWVWIIAKYNDRSSVSTHLVVSCTLTIYPPKWKTIAKKRRERSLSNRERTKKLGTKEHSLLIPLVSWFLSKRNESTICKLKPNKRKKIKRTGILLSSSTPMENTN